MTATTSLGGLAVDVSPELVSDDALEVSGMLEPSQDLEMLTSWPLEDADDELSYYSVRSSVYGDTDDDRSWCSVSSGFGHADSEEKSAKHTETLHAEVWFLNTCSLQAAKEDDLISEMRGFPWRAIGIAETWRGLGREEYVREDGHLFLGSGGTEGRCGVACLIHAAWKDKVVDWEPVSERLLRVDFSFNDVRMRLVVVYMPTANHSVDDVLTLYGMLLKQVAGARRLGMELILTGDFNAVVGVRQSPEENSWHGGFSLEQSRNDRGTLLAAWADANGLRIWNSFFQKREGQMAKHISGDRARTIDYILMPRDSRVNVKNVEVCEEMVLATDHRPLRMKFALELVQDRRRKKKRSYGFDFRGWQPLNGDVSRKFVEHLVHCGDDVATVEEELLASAWKFRADSGKAGQYAARIYDMCFFEDIFGR